MGASPDRQKSPVQPTCHVRMDGTHTGKLLPHWVPATWRSRAQTSMRAELPSGKLPTTRVRRRMYISLPAFG